MRLAYDPTAFRLSLYTFFGAPVTAVAIPLAAAIGRSVRRQPDERLAITPPERAGSLP